MLSTLQHVLGQTRTLRTIQTQWQLQTSARVWNFAPCQSPFHMICMEFIWSGKTDSFFASGETGIPRLQIGKRSREELTTSKKCHKREGPASILISKIWDSVVHPHVKKDCTRHACASHETCMCRWLMRVHATFYSSIEWGSRYHQSVPQLLLAI